jgi:hypothetical protein
VEKINEPSRSRSLRRFLLWTVASPFIVLILGIVGCEARKAYYDLQVENMCEKDGGVTTTQRIQITRELANRLPRSAGYLGTTTKALAGPDEPAVSAFRITEIREGQPRIVRTEETITRRSDGRLIAQVVRYARVGGDFPLTGSAPSHFECPDPLTIQMKVHKIFDVKEG